MHVRVGGQPIWIVEQAIAPRSHRSAWSGAPAATCASANIHAGLPVDVAFKLRKRTALTYLLEPLNNAIWRSFREN
jgi:hypothetical protein